MKRALIGIGIAVGVLAFVGLFLSKDEPQPEKDDTLAVDEPQQQPAHAVLPSEIRWVGKRLHIRNPTENDWTGCKPQAGFAADATYERRIPAGGEIDFGFEWVFFKDKPSTQSEMAPPGTLVAVWCDQGQAALDRIPAD